MIELNLSYEAEHYGREKKQQRDANGLPDHFVRHAHNDKRWTGLAAEYELHQYLRDSGVPHVWNDDSLAGLADYEFGAPELDAEGRLDVAFKANNGVWRDDFEFIMTFRGVNQVRDGVLLAIVNTPTRRLWIAGYLSRDRFLKLAQKRKKGDESFVPGRPLAAPCWTIRADQLEPAERFFELVRRTA